jgi:predicted nucleic acid-binding protein
MPEHVISNTSPPFYLHRLRQLDLLPKLYTRRLVPEAVVDESQAGRNQDEDVPEVTGYDWIEARAVRMPAVVTLITAWEPERRRS